MLMVLVMRLAAVLAALIQLPGIVAGFLGLAVNAAVRDKPAKQKVQFFAELFLCCDRLLIDPP